MENTKSTILDFWFNETAPQQWFQSSADFDNTIRSRFADTYEAAKKGSFKGWQKDADGSLALCLVLDQFPRNMFRGQPKAFATDNMALDVAKAAIEQGYDQVLSPVKRRFLYLPFMHSEDLAVQKRSVELYEAMKQDDPVGYEHALRHLREIETFGRFPYRNDALGRQTTPEEQDYLNTLSL